MELRTQIETAAHKIINDIHADLMDSLAAVGEELDAENLADSVGDRLCDEVACYTEIPYSKRRAIVMAVCKQYV